MNFSGDFGTDLTIWYPAAGSRYSSDGSLYGVGSSGYYWSATPSGSSAYSLDFISFGYVFPSNLSRRAGVCSVRCLQE